MTLRQDTIDVVALAMDAFNECWDENSEGAPKTEVDPTTGRTEFRNPVTAMEMLFNYVEERRRMLTSSQFKLLAVEQPFAVPLDPGDRSLIYVGRLDKVYEEAGRVYVAEHKTTSFYKKNGYFRNEFVDSFSPNSQVDGYLYAGGIIYGKAFKGVRIDASLVHAEVHDGFKLIPVERAFAQLDSWVWESRYWVGQLEANLEMLTEPEVAKFHEYLAAFPKNTSSCTQYGGCPYAELCKSWSAPHTETEPPLGFKVQKWSPFDELKLAEAKKIAGIDHKVNRKDRLYDNTRLSTFRTCGRRYYYRHVRHWETARDKRALLFGSSWHAAMDVVWKELAPNWPVEDKPSFLAKKRKKSAKPANPSANARSLPSNPKSVERPNPAPVQRSGKVGSKIPWISKVR